MSDEAKRSGSGGVEAVAEAIAEPKRTVSELELKRRVK